MRIRFWGVLPLFASFFTASAYPQSTAWTGGAGAWSNVSNWNPNPCAPNPPCYPSSPTVDVSIDGGNNAVSPVTQDVSANIGNLAIDSDDSLSVSDQVNLLIFGTSISNAGKITVTSSTGGSGVFLRAANTTLAGGGTVTLLGCEIGTTSGTQVLTNQETIQGAGVIGVNFNNQGVIDANGASPLNIDIGASNPTNSGTLEASGGGLLQFNQAGILNNSGGKIQALDGSTVQLGAVTIDGGTLTTTGTGVIHGFANGPILNGVTNSGIYQVQAPSSTTLEGTITNSGTIQVNATSTAQAVLNLTGTVTLTGGGTVALSDQKGNFVNGTLVNQNNTISGAGTFGNGVGTLTNAGVINATSANNNPLIIGESVTNTGIMEASSGGTLEITNSVTNTGGAIAALAGTGKSAGGTVLLKTLTVSGGTLTTSGSSINSGIIISSNSTFNGIGNAGTVQVQDNTQTFLEGAINNTGLIQLLSTSQGSNLRIIGNVTLSGTGSLSMLKNTFVYGQSGNETLTNQNTIYGAGNIGNNLMGLVNEGVINADLASPLSIQTGSNSFHNLGKLSVSKGSVLDITGGTFVNFTGTTLTGGTYLIAGTLQFDNANIVTNAANITLNGTSSQILDQSSHNALASFAANAAAGAFTLAGGQNLTTSSGFRNAGALRISKGSIFTAGGAAITRRRAGRPRWMARSMRPAPSTSKAVQCLATGAPCPLRLIPMEA